MPDDFQIPSDPPVRSTECSASQPETIKLLCFIEGADSATGEITLRSPASISGIKIGDFATVELKRYSVTLNHNSL